MSLLGLRGGLWDTGTVALQFTSIGIVSMGITRVVLALAIAALGIAQALGSALGSPMAVVYWPLGWRCAPFVVHSMFWSAALTRLRGTYLVMVQQE